MKQFEVLHSTWFYPVEGKPVDDHCFFTKNSNPAAYAEFDAFRKSPDVQTIVSMVNDSYWYRSRGARKKRRRMASE